MGSVGYYVHHHGAGHLTRFRAIAAASERELVPISEIEIAGGVRLPSDVPPSRPEDPTAGGWLHWAPLAPGTATPRLKALVDWLAATRPSAMVIDVSVEAALACRLAGVPTVVVRQHGDRSDAPHRMAYASAARLIAPYPAELESSPDADVVARTSHVGFITPPAERQEAIDRHGAEVRSGDAVVVWGTGGGHLGGRHVDALAANVDGTVYCAGDQIWPDDEPPTASNVVVLGWVGAPEGLVAARPLVVGSVGNNTVALAASAGCPFIAVPQERPFGEQHHLAASLAAVGVAALAPTQPEPRAWASAVACARRRSDRWQVLQPDGDGARRAAAVIDQVAGR